MTRPAVVIGLGGTGQWVATYVKRDLLEANGGESIPDNVKLLAFDTEALPSARAAGATGGKINMGGKEIDEKTYRSLFGNVMLDEKEYKHLGGNVREFCDAVKKGAHPHIGQWFAADWFIDKQPPTIFMLREGAAAWRQFGRLAAFYDLRNLSDSLIWSELKSAIDTIAQRDSRIGANRVIEVIVVTSIVGGTGAGMAIDIANVVREVAGSKPIALRGIFVLPQAFGTWKERDEDSTKKRARAFATWREMDRFRLLGGATGGLPITYSPSFQRVLDRPLFDAVYMVDGARNKGTALEPSGRPELHVYPMLSDFINVLLDGQAGQEFSARALNLASNDNSPQVPKYSAVGTFSLKSPVYYVMQEQTHRFAQDFLREWLQIQPSPKMRGAFVMASDRNQEGEHHIGQPGREAALTFLRSDAQRWQAPDGTVHEANATYFPSEIAEVVSAHQTQTFNIDERFILGAGREEWWDIFTNLRTAGASALRDELDEALDIRLDSVAPASRVIKEDPAYAPARLDIAVPQFVREYFGGVSEKTGRDQTGKYGSALGRVRERQVDRFREMLRVWMLKTLMGDSTNPRVARVGKAGFVYDFLDGLLSALDRYVKFIDHIQSERQRLGIANELARNADDAERQMMEHANDKWPFVNTPKPSAFNAQENYLRIKQDQITARKDDIFYRELRQAAEEMRSVVRTTLTNFQQLNDTLVGNSDQGNEGLYKELNENLDQVSTGRSRESSDMAQIQRVFELQVVQQMRDEMLELALGNVEWRVEPVDGALDVRVHLSPIGTSNGDGPATKLALATGRNKGRQNIQTLLQFSQKAFDRVWAANRIAHILMEEYDQPGGAAELARTMRGMAEPLYRESGTGASGPSAFSQWVRIQREGDSENAFLRVFESELAELEKRYDTKMLQSEDPYRLTLVRTDDLIPSTYFQEYEDSKRHYLEVAQKYEAAFGPKVAGRLMHSFPAEGNALSFELELYRLFRRYDPLHPLVVAGLEHVDRAVDFFWAYLLNYIWLESGGGGRYYVLRIPYLNRDGSINKEEYQQPLWLTTTQTVGGIQAEGDNIFRALANFVAYGRDVREGSHAQVNYDRVREVIRATLQEYTEDEIRAKVRELIEGEQGLVNHLRDVGWGLEQSEGQGDEAKAYYDLARIIVLLMVQSAHETYHVDLELGSGGPADNRLRALLTER